MKGGDSTDISLAILVAAAFIFGIALLVSTTKTKENEYRQSVYLAWQKQEGTDKAKQTTYEEFYVLWKAGLLQEKK